MYEPITNFRDRNGVDLGKKLVTEDYLLEVYGSLLDTLAPGLTFTPALWNWGNNGNGQLGVNDITQRNTPVTTILGGTNWKSVSSGGSFTAAIKTDGTLWNWGNNGNGQLGVNDTTQRNSPVTTILGGTNWKSVSSGSSHVAAIKTDGTLWTWGANASGQLGINNTTQRNSPVTTILGGTNWKSVSSGSSHVAAIKTDGTLWTWGANASGQLGAPNTFLQTVSTPITTILGGTNWKSVDCGDLHTTAIKTDGTLWVWGANASGQLGVNNTTYRDTPVTTILGGTNWKSVSGGGDSTAAIKTDGTLWTWGSNGYGKLGVNNTTNRNSPVTTILGGTNWKSVSGGDTHMSAIKTDGTLWVWGRGFSIGLGDSTNRSIPVTTILGGTNWKSVSSGDGHAAAIRTINNI